jgi:hypothetical protein
VRREIKDWRKVQMHVMCGYGESHISDFALLEIVISIFTFFAKVSPTSLELSSSFVLELFMPLSWQMRVFLFYSLILAPFIFSLSSFLLFLWILLARGRYFLLGIFLENHLIGRIKVETRFEKG